MTSPARSFTRDEATASSPFRNAFASSSTKPLHSPFLNRRSRASNDLSYTRRDTVSKSNTTRQPDAISTSSSTLVNAESTSDYRPWEVRSESSNSSLDSATISRGGRATPTLSALDDIGTLPSIHISPLPNRTASRNSRQPAAGRLSNESGRRSVDSSLTRARPVRQLCPDDCRCSDQDIDLGLCRRVVGSSSSGSDSASLSVGMHPMRQRATDPIPNSAPDVSGHNNDDMHLNDNNIISIRQGDYSEHSSHSQSVSRSQGRDFDKDPILVPRSARSKGSARSPTASTYQRSFDQLQRGLDTLESNDSDADSDADQAAAAQQRAESMARWTARRTSLSQSSLDRRSPSSKLDLPPEATVSPPRSKGRTSLASDASMPRRTSESKLSDEQASPRFSSPLKATPGRKSIAAVFESMQKEREARAAEEHKQWQEKQARRERERAARAFGVPSRRRTSASSSQFDSPGSAYTAPDTPLSQTNNNTTAYQSMISNNSTTAYQSMVSRATPSRSPVSSLISATPLLSSPGSPKMDESAAADVQPRHLGEEAAGRIPETLAEDEELEAENDGIDQPSNIEAKPQVVEDEPEAEIALPTTPQTRNTSAFAFSSQPMALDLSPVRSVSDSSSPASSPRKNAHRRQNTNTVSVAARLPPASLGLARQRLNQVLRQAPEESTPVRNGDDESFEQAKVEVQPDVFPQTPIGILSSAKKKTLPQLSAARRGHSVRFSPRPDYRSDSGSWDDSGTHNEEEDNSREAAVSRLLLPAKQITIPEVLASASVPALPTPTHKAVIEEGTPISELEPSFEDQPQRLEPPAKLENTETPSKPHTPAIAALQTTDNDSMSASVAGSFSQSLRFPGAYAPTPVKKYSRHVIKPSPKVTRVLPLPEPQNRPPSPGAGEPFGLFPDPTVDSTSLHIPRESTPPPLHPASSRNVGMLAPDDPRNSPRSPRPVNLGREQFGRFHAGSSDDSSGSFETKSNTAANENRPGTESVHNTIGRILQQVNEAHAGRVRRMQLFGQRLGGVSDRVAEARGDKRGSIEGATGRLGGLQRQAAAETELEEDRRRAEELKGEVMTALASLADRIVQLQSSRVAAGDPTILSVATSSVALPEEKGMRRKSMPRWLVILLIMAQCALMAGLMALAEQKAARLRMFSPSPSELRFLYQPSSSTVEWNAVASDSHLVPLLRIPILHHLTRAYPPLPSPTALNFHNITLLDLWRGYVRVNGVSAFVAQLVVYAISQLLGCALLLLIAPLQVVWFLVQPDAF